MVWALGLDSLEDFQIMSCHRLDAFRGRLGVVQAWILDSIKGLVFAQVESQRIVGKNDPASRMDTKQRRFASFRLDRHKGCRTYGLFTHCRKADRGAEETGDAVRVFLFEIHGKLRDRWRVENRGQRDRLAQSVLKLINA